MSDFITFIRNKHALIQRFVLIFASIVIIIAFLPKEKKFKFDYQKGKPWLHEDLIAPFDFAIFKTDEDINQQKDAIIKSFVPFYKLNTEIKNKNIDQFVRELDRKFNSIQPSLSNKVKTKIRQDLIFTLNTLYDNGIINLHSIHEKNSSDFKINILNSNVVTEKTLKQLFTLKDAYKHLQKVAKTVKTIDASFVESILVNSIEYNIIYDDDFSEKHLQRLLDNVSVTRGMMQEGEKIISKGDIVEDQKYLILQSLKNEYEHQTGSIKNYYFIVLGQVILLTIAFAVLVIFLNFFRKDVFSNNRKITLIFLLIIFMTFLVSWGLKSGIPSIYVLPFCIVPIIIRALFDTRLAFFIHLIIILSIAFYVPRSFEFVFLQTVAGLVAIFSIVNIRKRGQFFISATLIFCTYTLIYSGITLIQEGDIYKIELLNLSWFLLSALLTLISYLLIYGIEKIFGFTTDVSLMELADTNNPLLKELSLKAPGTFHHSMQVANLAEAAIYEIGGNSALVRAGALYHDIGKMDMPAYFIENLTGEINPHDELPYEESAKIIINHVIKGIERAKKHKLPDVIIDFIRTHHGTSRVEYFYREYLKNMPEEENVIDENEFSYPGPLPYSKETAVLMMADAVEASSRSLKDHSIEKLDDLVEKIINNQIGQNQFVNSNITFSDITAVKKVFKKMLKGIYHIRIEYVK